MTHDRGAVWKTAVSWLSRQPNIDSSSVLTGDRLLLRRGLEVQRLEQRLGRRILVIMVWCVSAKREGDVIAKAAQMRERTQPRLQPATPLHTPGSQQGQPSR
jgi:hypothetical protein